MPLVNEMLKTEGVGSGNLRSLKIPISLASGGLEIEVLEMPIWRMHHD